MKRFMIIGLSLMKRTRITSLPVRAARTSPPVRCCSSQPNYSPQPNSRKPCLKFAYINPLRLVSVRNIITMTSASEVKHDEGDHVFYMQIQKGDVAKLEYNWVDKGTIDFYHTEVPLAYRGMGCAKLLAKAALDFAVEKDVKIIVSCSYLAKFVSDNPNSEYTSRIIQQ